MYAGAARGMSGTAGGIFRCAVGDERWERCATALPDGADVQVITVHPDSPDVLYAGTQDGPYRSTDRGARWERLGFPAGGWQVWSILVHPADPRILYLGTSPAAVYRSHDGGDSWRRLDQATPPERVKMGFATRVMRLAADPRRPQELYAALEVGGVMHSPDGGERWVDCSADLLRLAELPHLKSRIGSDTDSEGMMDVHAVAVSEARPGTAFVALRMGLFRSADRGATWEDIEIGRFSPLTYARDVRVAPGDPRVLYTCLSPAARSQAGSLYRSQDVGRTWSRFDHGVEARSTMMAVALHPRDPDQVYCATRHGQVFGTRDDGRTWRELPLLDGVGDVYALACG